MEDKNKETSYLEDYEDAWWNAEGLKLVQFWLGHVFFFFWLYIICLFIFIQHS